MENTMEREKGLYKMDPQSKELGSMAFSSRENAEKQTTQVGFYIL